MRQSWLTLLPMSPARFAGITSSLVMAIGGLVMVGWAFDVPLLKTVLPGLVSMKPNTALALLLAGGAVQLARAVPLTPQRLVGIRLLAGLIAAIGGLTLLEYLGGWSLGLDQLLFADAVRLVDPPYPGRMAPTTALTFVLTGGALLLLPHPRTTLLGQGLALIVGLVGLLNIVGYLYGVQAFSGFVSYTQLALHTAIAFLLLSLGLLALVTKRGVVAVVISPYVGGLLARRLLPVALIVPILLGALCLWSQNAGIDSIEFGVALFALATSLIFAALVWWTARTLNRLDAARGEAEATGRAQEARFQLLFTHNPLPMWVYDRETLRFLEVNDAAVATYGYSAAEFCQMQITDIRPPEELDRLHADLAAPRPALQQAGEWRHRYKDGTLRNVEIVSHVIEYTGRPASLVVVHDITARKLAEAALRENEQRLYQFLEAIPLGVVVLDTHQTPYYANHAFQQLFQRPIDLAAAVDEVAATYPTYLAGTSQPYPPDRAPSLRALAGEASMIEDAEVRHPDHVIPIQVWGAPIVDEQGKVVYSLAAFADITSRKRAEAELAHRALQQESVAALGQRALEIAALDPVLAEGVELAALGLDADAAALSELSPDGKTLTVCQVYGWPTEIIGQTRAPLDRTTQAGATLLANKPLILDDAHPQPEFDITPIVRERGARSALSVIIPGPDQPFGVLIVHSIRGHTFTPYDIQFLQTLANVLGAAVERDRSSAARAERDAAAAANVAKSDFLSRMSHELRTPLNAILGFGELLELDQLSSRQVEHVAQILKAGRYLLELINEVLDISRIEAGHLTLSPEPVLLRDVLAESLALVQPGAAHRQITFSTPDLTTATAYVQADQQRLKQVLLNLLSNAIKYNRQGGMVTIAWGSPTPERLRLTVADTGRGISPDTLGQLFQPFARLGAEASGVEGTGLGLALSQHLMTAMGGALGLERTGEAGSTFWLELPLTTAPAEPPVRRAPTAELVTIQGPARTLLLIDDNLSNQRLIERVLELRPGITLLAALQGRRGLELARAHRPDLILLDLQLPDLGGEIVLRRLLDDPVTATIPIVIFSADATPGQQARLRAAGAQEYLTKPFHVSAFLALIDRLLPQAKTED